MVYLLLALVLVLTALVVVLIKALKKAQKDLRNASSRIANLQLRLAEESHDSQILRAGIAQLEEDFNVDIIIDVVHYGRWQTEADYRPLYPPHPQNRMSLKDKLGK